MKYDPIKAYPHPVLRPGSDDYGNAAFQSSAQISSDELDLVARIQYELSSKYIRTLIKDGLASFTTVISCRETFFSLVFHSDTTSATRSFLASNVRGELRIHSFVTVLADEITLSSEEFHPEWQGQIFTLRYGDVIAEDEPLLLYIDKDTFRPTSSIIDLKALDTINHGEWRVSLESEHITILVNPDMKRTIDQARNTKSNQAILINSLYFGALIYALDALKLNAEEYADRSWASVIRKQLHNSELTLSQPTPSIAQHLLRYPLSLLDKLVFHNTNEMP